VHAQGNLSKLTNRAATFPADGTKATDVGLAEIDSLAVDTQGRTYVGDSQSGLLLQVDGVTAS
jgi:hypothetical protein